MGGEGCASLSAPRVTRSLQTVSHRVHTHSTRATPSSSDAESKVSWSRPTFDIGHTMHQVDDRSVPEMIVRVTTVTFPLLEAPPSIENMCVTSVSSGVSRRFGLDLDTRRHRPQSSRKCRVWMEQRPAQFHGLPSVNWRATSLCRWHSCYRAIGPLRGGTWLRLSDASRWSRSNTMRVDRVLGEHSLHRASVGDGRDPEIVATEIVGNRLPNRVVVINREDMSQHRPGHVDSGIGGCLSLEPAMDPTRYGTPLVTIVTKRDHPQLTCSNRSIKCQVRLATLSQPTGTAGFPSRSRALWYHLRVDIHDCGYPCHRRRPNHARSLGRMDRGGWL
jgi:hypothetical protein